MEELMTYVKPELLAVSVVLYLLGMVLEKTGRIAERYIPVILCAAGIVICGIWVFSTSQLAGIQSILLAVFTSIVQGTLVTGLTVGSHRLLTGRKKK